MFLLTATISVKLLIFATHNRKSAAEQRCIFKCAVSHPSAFPTGFENPGIKPKNTNCVCLSI